MSDEQTRVLQEILAAINEQNALTKQFRAEAMAVQHLALDRQRRNVRIAFAFMAALIAFLVFTVAKG